MEVGARNNPRTVEEVFRDFKGGRRIGLIKALTTDVEEFFQRCDPELSVNASQAEISQQPIVQYADPYFSGLFTAYGPHNIIQPQNMAAASGRVPLPVDLPEDGPIYVNAKQYQGILRRRQTRAKLEAQNKLVKTRKPYLHESRRQHALNRVRGTGGRFLSTKRQQSDSHSLPPSSSTPDSFPFSYIDHRVKANKYDAPSGGGGEGTRVSSGNTILQQSGAGFQAWRFPCKAGAALSTMGTGIMLLFGEESGMHHFSPAGANGNSSLAL